jgi:predicted small lipoprotein YifL
MSAKLVSAPVVALVLSMALAGCGSSGHSGLSSADAARLRADIAAARTAAARHEAPQAASSLVAFRRQVTRLAAEHKLSAGEAQALETGAEQAQARVPLDVKPAPAPAPTTPTTAAPVPPAVPAAPGPPGKAKGHDKHEGPGKHGDGPGDGGD